MAVETSDDHHTEHDGQVFWFCSWYCCDEFLAIPQRFVTHPTTLQPDPAEKLSRVWR